MRRVVYLVLTTFLVSILSFGCATNKAQQGAVLGTLAGAAVGAQVGKKDDRRKNALIGAGIGLVLGYIIGNEWDKYDQQKLNQTLEYAKSEIQTTWTNPDTGKTYSAIPHSAYNQSGRICRKVTILCEDEQGNPKKVVTTACRNPYGQWEIQR